MDRKSATQQTKLPTLCKNEDEWVAVLTAMTADLAPRTFALFAEYGEREDAALIAWGMDNHDHVVVSFTDRTTCGRFSSVENVKRLFCGPGKLRFVWVPPATQPS